MSDSGFGRAPRTVCKICGCSIFEADKTLWTRQGTTPGLAHAFCVVLNIEPAGPEAPTDKEETG